MTRASRFLLAALLLSLAYGGVTRWQVRRLTSSYAALSDSAAVLRERAAVSASKLDSVNQASLALVADTARIHAALRDSRRRGATLLAEARAAAEVAADPATGDTLLRATLAALTRSVEEREIAARTADSLAAARIRLLEAQLLASVSAGETALADAHAACEARIAREIARLTAERPTKLQRVASAGKWLALGWVAGKADVP